VLQKSGAGAAAKVWRRSGFAGVLACALMAIVSSAALADRRPQPDPSELWQSYPLEQKPSTVAKSPAAGDAQQRPARGSVKGRAPASSAAKPSGGPSAALIAIVAAAAGLLGLGAVALRRRRRQPVAAGPVFSPRAAPRTAPVAAAPAQRVLAPPPPRPVPAERSAEPAPPRPPTARRALEPRPPMPAPAAQPRHARRAAAARQQSTCQVRWNRRGRSFYAASVDSNGIEHMIASSPRLEEAGPAPPHETTETRVALRQLAKELRGRGWRPLRAKGIDFDERRWYARRFRWPTEEELAVAGQPDASESDEQVSGRSVGGR
jgi:MYXO-CTERM domain-containing protein